MLLKIDVTPSIRTLLPKLFALNMIMIISPTAQKRPFAVVVPIAHLVRAG